MKSHAKVLSKMINAFGFNELGHYDWIRKYRNEKHRIPEPMGKKNYVGIEIECFAKLNDDQAMELALEYDLEKYIDITGDGSILPDNHDQKSFEFRLLCTEDELPEMFKRLKPFLREGRFKVNKTCGLHVHLDMRHRNPHLCGKKLKKFQDIMFGLVKKERWDNVYCVWSDDNNEDERYAAVNLTAYDDHETIEIRLHHGSVDVKEISNWVNLLLKCINGKMPPKVESKADVLKLFTKEKGLKSYVKKKFARDWFDNKDDYIHDGYDDMEEPVW